jgi:two-component system, NarL family, nitrate/nitrite response regulator NarL
MLRPTTRVLVADDEWPWRESVASVLSRAPDLDVVAQAATTSEAFRLVAETTPDVALVDLQMPEDGGIALTRRIRARHPGTRVLVFTVSRDADDAVQVLRAGSSGYVVKQETRDPRRLCELVRLAADGGAVVTCDDAVGLMTGIARRDPPDPLAAYRLTRRERDVLVGMARGLTNRQIAEQLTITEQSVKNHVRNVLAKLQVPNRAAAAALVHERRLMERAGRGDA